MILGKIDRHEGQGLVAFLDILGFSKEIMEKWGNSEDNPLAKILELKEHIPVFSNDELVKTRSDSKGTRVYPCRIQTISDSIIVSFGLDNPPMYGDLLLGTISFFDTISVIWRNCLEAGFTIRGACDYGDIYWDEKEIIGPAFINVYKLEMKMAKTSRVIVSSSFNKHLKSIYTQDKTFWNEIILKVLRKDIDGFIILNPHTLYSDKNEKEERQHVIEMIEQLRNNAKGIIREKYSPLLSALNTEKLNLEGNDLGKY